MSQGRAIDFNPEKLEWMYWVLGLNGMEIAEILGCGWHSIY